jgi:hypothetical protein
MKIGAVFRFLIQEVTTITPGRGKLLYCYYHLYELPEATRAMLLPRINSGEALSSQKTCDSLDTKSVPESSELGDDSQASREDSNGEGSASNASLPSFNRAPSSSSAPSPSLRPMVWSESPNLRSQVGLSPSIRPMVGLYGDKKMVQVLPSMPSMERRPSMLSMDPPSMDRPCVRQVKSVALHDSRQSVFRSTALSPSSEDSAWARHAAAEVDARKRAKKAMISGVAKMFNL